MKNNISLLDHFAGLIIQGICSNQDLMKQITISAFNEGKGGTIAEALADYAYVTAEAMIKMREGREYFKNKAQ